VLGTIHAMQAYRGFAIARTRSPARETHALPTLITQREQLQPQRVQSNESGRIGLIVLGCVALHRGDTSGEGVGFEEAVRDAELLDHFA